MKFLVHVINSSLLMDPMDLPFHRIVTAAEFWELIKLARVFKEIIEVIIIAPLGKVGCSVQQLHQVLQLSSLTNYVINFGMSN